jgi:hypothetical protein
MSETSQAYPVSIHVPAGHVLTIRNGGAVVVTEQREPSSLGEPHQPWHMAPGSFKEYGAYPDARNYLVDGEAGTLSYEIAAAGADRRKSRRDF